MVFGRVARRVFACAAVFLGLHSVAHATNHITRLNEVMAGLNGDSSIQFVEIVADGHSQKDWGPLFGEPVGRAMLVFFDENGNRTGRFVVPSNPDQSGTAATTVLFATPAFAALTGITPDFIIPPSLSPNAGKVCFMNNPDNPSAFFVDLCLAYGGPGFTGTTKTSEGAANTSVLSLLNSQSLTRVIFDTFGSFGDGAQRNADFELRAPTPSSTKALKPGVTQADLANNVLGQVVFPTAVTLPEQGRNLFSKETFRGNGRTCSTCHVQLDKFALTPARVGTLPADNALFVHEKNINTLVVNSTGSVRPGSLNGAQPSDFTLGGVITGNLGGSARILAGTGTTYLVIGGQDLNVPGNLISDSKGNKGTLVSFTPGNLQGPSPLSGLNEPLEHTERLRGSRALITENIDGFSARAVMRGSPMLMNLQHTAPYGLSGEIPTLQEFSRGAVVQHAPRRLNRVPGVDFREPTTQELDALAAFQNTITAVADGNFDEANQFDRFATTAAQKRGRDLFFGAAKCSACHSGKTLNLSDGRFGTQAGVNQNFNTGVVALAVNTANNMPTEENTGSPPNSREFNTPSVFGIRGSNGFFHDNAVPDLLQAVQFYDTPQFRNSPAHALVGDIDVVSIPQNAADLVAFLEALGDVPFTFTPSADFGELALGTNLSKTVSVIGGVDLSVTNFTITGANAADFTVVPVPQPPPSGGGSTTFLTSVVFAPGAAGLRTATLEMQVEVNSETFNVGVALKGIGMSTTAPDIDISPTAINFGSRDVNAGATAPLTVTITNIPSATESLNLTGISLIGVNAPDFAITVDSGETVLAPGASRAVQLVFDPLAAGARTAALRIASNDPNESGIDVALFGTGAAPEITVTPASMSAGTVDVAQPPAGLTLFSIRNDGQLALSVSGVSLVGTNAADFVIVSDSAETSLAPGASRTVGVAFDPPTTGTKSAQLHIVSNDADEGVIDLALSGNAINPEIAVTPSSLSFGNQRVSSGSTVSQAVTVVNAGTTALSLTTVAIEGVNATDFSILSGGGSATVNPGLSRTVSIAFDPTVIGARTANLRISSNDFDEGSVLVPLSGIGVDPEIDITPLSVSFGSQDIGAGPTLAQTILIRNLGNANLAITSVSLSQSIPGEFTIVSDTAQTSIAPGAARQVQIAFDPVSTGSKFAQLNVFSDDSNESFVSVSLFGTGAAPEITVSALNIIFSDRDVAAGPGTSVLVSIRNDGGVALTVSSVTLAGTHPADFVIVSDTGQTSLAPAATRLVTVAFDPTLVGLRSAQLRIVSNDADEATVNVNLSGTGIAPEIDVTPTSLSFGNQPVIAGATASQSVVVTNTGSTNLTISSVSLGGANTLDFTLTPSTVFTTLPAGGQLTVQVAFDPTALGNRVAELRIVSNDANEGLVIVPLSGTGTAPEITITPTSLNFGSQDINAGPTPAQTVTLRNDGNGTLTIANVSLVGAAPGQFAIVSDSGGTVLAAGTQRTLTIAFDPSVPGAASAAVRVVSNDADEGLVDVQLAGTGTSPEITVTPAALNFGARDLRAGASVAQSIAVKNDGNGALAISALSITGVNAAEFSIESDTGETTIAPGATRTINVAFDPAAILARSAQLHIASSDADEASIDVALSGSGTDPEISISPATIDFGNRPIAAGASATQIVSITNNGTTALTIVVNLWAGANSVEFGLGPVPPGFGTIPLPSQTLQPGASHDISVAFDPAVTGTRNHQIVVTSDDLDESSITISLTGVGTDPEVSVTPSNLSFGTHDIVAGATLAQSIVIRNDGTADLTVSNVAIEGVNAGEFQMSSDTAQTTLPPGSARSVQVRFDPSSAGTKSASVGVTTNDGNEPKTLVALIGTAVNPEIALNGSTVNFGVQNMDGGAGAAKQIVITNAGTTALNVASVSLVGADAELFSVASDSGETTLAASAARTLSLTFDPARSGPHAASVVVVSNDLDESVASIVLLGSGNATPVITGQKPIVTAVGAAREIVLADLSISDADNSGPGAFTVAIQSGANYTTTGNTVLPNAGFAGTLSVPTTVSDGSAVSAAFAVAIAVTNDRDGDGTPDAADAFPDNPAETIDTDADGIGNNADTDDDNDGLTDAFELSFNSNPLVLDTDADGLTDSLEALRGTDPRASDTDQDGLADGVDTQPLKDNVAPALMVPPDINVTSTGLLTNVALGTAQAADARDGAVVAIPSTSGPFPPGHNLVTWTATDAAGNSTTATQAVDVTPLAYIELEQTIAEGAHVSVQVMLNGNAVTYPVSVPYTVSGSAAAGTDHTLVSGVAMISASSGNFAKLEFDVNADGVSDNGETIVITLGPPTGAQLGAASQFTATIIDTNQIPTVRFDVEQIGQSGISAPLITGGAVSVFARLDGDAAFGAWTYDWSGTDARLVNTSAANASVFAFQPSNLNPGIYRVAVRVVSNNGLPQVASGAQMYLRVVKSWTVLSNAADSDGDAIIDATEGEGDVDGDGSPDYLDNVTQPNTLQLLPGKAQPVVIADAQGRLQLGDVAFGVGAAQVTSGQIVVHHSENGHAPMLFVDTFGNVGGYVDVQIADLASSGMSVRLLIPQSQPMPVDAVLRLLDPNGGWRDFAEDGANRLLSASRVNGVCPAFDDPLYTAGLTAGRDCVQVVILEGGVNDVSGAGDFRLSLLAGVAQGRPKDAVAPGDTTKSKKGGGGVIGAELVFVVFSLLLMVSRGGRGTDKPHVYQHQSNRQVGQRWLRVRRNFAMTITTFAATSFGLFPAFPSIGGCPAL